MEFFAILLIVGLVGLCLVVFATLLVAIRLVFWLVWLPFRVLFWLLSLPFQLLRWSPNRRAA